MNLSLTAKLILGATTALVVSAVVFNSLVLAKIDHLNADPRLTPRQFKLLELQDLHATAAMFLNDPAFAEYRELLAAACKRCVEAKQPEVTEEALVDSVTYVKGILTDVSDLKKSETAE